MYASVIEGKAKPGMTDALVAAVRDKLPEIAQLAGIKQLVSIDLGNDEGLTLVIYESQEAQEAATPRATEILGGMAEFYAAPPNRRGCTVLLNEAF